MANAPAVGVSWVEAMAFCGWLAARLGHAVGLPTEWEWQLAATGGVPGRMYPWGERWEPERLHKWGTGPSGVVPVGLYPHGASACGALDMLGNVWEWCANSPAPPYNVDLSLDMLVRSIRGSSWLKSPDVPHCGLRDRMHVTDKLPYLGFRVVARNSDAATPVTVSSAPVH